MNDLEIVLKAALFAAEKHKDHRRKDEESSPYINHPLKVAALLSGIGGVTDGEIIAAALLHDTVEDTETTFDEIEEHFGEATRNYVSEVTDDKSLSRKKRKLAQLDHASKLSYGATLIKICDKISNVHDVIYTPPPNWKAKRRLEYVEWAASVVDNCPETNSPLKDSFYNKLAEAREKIGGCHEV